MDPYWIGAIVIGASVALVALSRVLSRARQTKRALAGHRQFSIASLPAGRTGRIAGMVTPVGRPLVAPLTGRACVYYHSRVEQARLEGSEFANKKTLVDKTDVVPFAIDDGTGYALVEVRRIAVALDEDLSHATGAPDELDPRQAALLAEHSISPSGVLFSKTLVFTEELIEPGERIAAAGVCVPDGAPTAAAAGADAPYREAPPTVAPAPRKIRLVPSRTAPLLLSDDPDLAPPLDDEV